MVASIADTTRALTLKETTLSAGPVHPTGGRRYVAAAADRSQDPLPHKSDGDAAYYTIQVDGRAAENSVWTYEHPYPAVAAIKGHLAFYPDRGRSHRGAAGDPGGKAARR